MSCIPEFWLALLFILLFSVQLQWLPAGGAYTVGGKQDLSDRLLHLALPLMVVVASHLWYYAYMIRNLVLEEVRADYVLFARSKGLHKTRILFCHCLWNVIPSYLSLMAVSVPHILGGTYMVELVFSYPGLGMLSYESARYKDVWDFEKPRGSGLSPQSPRHTSPLPDLPHVPQPWDHV